jgi:hypothetical protein
MTKARMEDIYGKGETPPHYQFDEFRQTEMINVVNALNGLAQLIHDGTTETARNCDLEVPREDLAAIITVISKHAQATLSDMPFVPRTMN